MAVEQPKVLFLNRAHPVLSELLTQEGFQCEEDLDSTADQLKARIPHYTGVVMRSRIDFRSDLIDAASKLKFIAREGVGTEHIDVEYAASQGIQVITSPEGSRDTVGEHALGLLLGLMNHLARTDRQVRERQWLREPNRGTEIKGKTIGILGYGNMGTAFAEKVSGLGARVIAYDKYKTEYGDQYAEAVDLETLQREAEILSIHIPYEPTNHHFIDGALLDGFHHPIYLVNTARGLVLNTSDLVDRLKTRQVLGAALDVLEYEEGSFDQVTLDDPPPPLAYLLKSDQVLLSPHIAGWSFESKRKHGEVLAEKIIRQFGVDFQ
jgi:D-3-phosphoglycerate dehydrogenase